MFSVLIVKILTHCPDFQYLDKHKPLSFAESSEYGKLAMMYQAHMAELLCDLCQICFTCARKAIKQSDAIQWCKLAIDAIDTSDASAGKEPDIKAEVLWFLANLYMETGAVDTAKQVIDAGLEEVPNALCGHYLNLRILAQKGADAKAMEEAFTLAVAKCVTSLKKSAPFKMLLSMIHLLATRASPESTAAGIEAALAHFSDTPAELDQRETLRILKMHVLLSATDSATAVTREIDAIVADKATQEGRWNDAIQWYLYSRRLLMDDPTDAKNAAIIKRKLAICYLELKSYEDAFEALEIRDIAAEHSAESHFIAFVAKMELSDSMTGTKGNKDALKQVLRHVVMSPLDWNVSANKVNLLAVLR
ncbi:hypothetical protein HDU86_000021 [Geranomyces michiganensis]|nr:hypothetical protein HDU86_000021 [Geranomyces michiganensis]